jgi:3D (Asp-Asp-Asp) domain-containing protein
MIRTGPTKLWTLVLLLTLVVAIGATAAARAPAAPRSPDSSGGAPVGGLAPTHSPKKTALPRPPGKHDRGQWLHGFEITEYWPVPESWFAGSLVTAPGLAGKHRIDWLYSAQGVSMEGDGIGLDGRPYHLDAAGRGGWVTRAGASTSSSSGWAAGAPYWRAGGYWRNRRGAVTFPLERGGWSNGTGRKYVPLPGVKFASGPSLPLRFYESIAVDPHVIPLGSRVYIPAYEHDGHGGWFVAQDTGGAITGRHVDVYRPPPPSSTDSGALRMGMRVYVIKPARSR